MTNQSLPSAALANSKPMTAAPTARSQFSSRLGFIVAAAGCAVGIGNIWSFPAQTAENGGAAFVLVYLCLSFVLAYPTLVAELTIGHYRRTEPVSALQQLHPHPWWQAVGALTGTSAVLTIITIYSFYSIVGGWFIGFGLAPMLSAVGLDNTFSTRLTDFSRATTIVLTVLFMAVTTWIVTQGVKDGIERWSNRFMPLLLLLLCGLIAFALTQPGGMAGLKMYLWPDFSRLLDAKLLISALGQSFFSMSLGVGAMLVYGSYLNKDTHLPGAAMQVAVLDTGIAFVAGLLVIPCLHIAMLQGIEVYSPTGTLYSTEKLVFTVLPALFAQLGGFSHLVSCAFFLLLTVAALTSAIAMLETPVSCLIERFAWPRKSACWLITALALTLSTTIICHMETLLPLTVQIATRYLQPVLSLLMVVYCGWLIRQDKLLAEIRQGFPRVAGSLFWKIWPWYIRLVCPALIVLLLLHGTA